MEAGWGKAFLEHFRNECDEDAIATIVTRDNREILVRHDEVEVLETFPSAWVANGATFIPESEIVRVEIHGA